MNIKQVEAAILYHAYLNDSRDNAVYEFSEAEEKRFWKAIQNVQARIFKMAETHFDEEVYNKIYGKGWQ